MQAELGEAWHTAQTLEKPARPKLLNDSQLQDALRNHMLSKGLSLEDLGRLACVSRSFRQLTTAAQAGIWSAAAAASLPPGHSTPPDRASAIAAANSWFTASAGIRAGKALEVFATINTEQSIKVSLSPDGEKLVFCCLPPEPPGGLTVTHQPVSIKLLPQPFDNSVSEAIQLPIQHVTPQGHDPDRIAIKDHLAHSIQLEWSRPDSARLILALLNETDPCCKVFDSCTGAQLMDVTLEYSLGTIHLHSSGNYLVVSCLDDKSSLGSSETAIADVISIQTEELAGSIVSQFPIPPECEPWWHPKQLAVLFYQGWPSPANVTSTMTLLDMLTGTVHADAISSYHDEAPSDLLHTWPPCSLVAAW